MSVRCVAEFGQSHGGNLNTAKRQANAARAAGCWAVKFQIFDPTRIASRYARRYWAEDLGGSDTQLETFQNNGMLADEEWRELACYCREVAQIQFMATPFDLEAVDLLEDIGVSAIKIASGDLTYKQLLRRVAQTDKYVILSTGASLTWEIAQALEFLHPRTVVLLACTLSYPTADKDADLARIPHLAQNFSWTASQVGYSDHTLGVETALAAAALGADYLEKHCRLDAIGDVPDDRMAIDPKQLQEYVRLAQHGALLRGSGAICPSPSEMPARVGARRSIYASRDLPAGHVLAESDFAFLRPCPRGAPSPAEADRLVGKALSSSIKVGELIRP